MHENLMDRGPGLDDLPDWRKARVAKTWQRFYEDTGYGLWGFSPSPAAKILAEAILASNPRRSERVEIIDWGCG
jgi:hypothetical protein